jgi:hypothetical protein
MKIAATLSLVTFILAGTPAFAAGICKAEKLSCGTNMPVGGYCECTARGVTESGTVVERTRAPVNSTSGGCGTRPNAPGCK